MLHNLLRFHIVKQQRKVLRDLTFFFVHSQLHAKEKTRFDFADMDGSDALNLTEFLAFTHPSEVDHMAVSIK